MIYKLKPACKDYLWGGTRLKAEYGKQSDTAVIAETWELSCHEDGLSVIEATGKTLQQHCSENPTVIGTACAQFDTFPMLIKLIDAQKDLSIQVHPDDAYAKEHEGQLGKTEMWYIVDCTDDACLYYGFREKITKDELHAAIRDNTICEKLNQVPVKKGDVFFIEAGTVHAIGAGCLIAEIQQSSNVTYRVYDYNRLDANGQPRALHIEKACEVAKTEPAKIYPADKHLASCKYFTVDKLNIAPQKELTVDESSFAALLVVKGQMQIKNGNQTLQAQKGDSLFIDAGSGKITIEGDGEALLAYIEKQKVKVGIDLGGTNINAGVLDENNHILASSKCKTGAQRPWQEIVADMAKMAQAALLKAGFAPEDCSFVGIGCPGTVDAENGVVVYSNNLNWENVPLVAEFQKHFAVDVKISNDANCAALGEVVAGAAKLYKNAVLLTLGTGVGGGVVIDGKLFEGGVGGAELGHTTLVYGGALCTCGRKGCLESYCSATALIREAKDAASKNPQSLLSTLCKGDLSSMNGIIPFEAMRSGDETAAQVVNQYIEWLGAGIVNFVNIFRPEVVLLSGGICGEGAFLTDPLNAYVKRYAFAGTRIAVPPVLCATLGNDAGVIGAASL